MHLDPTSGSFVLSAFLIGAVVSALWFYKGKRMGYREGIEAGRLRGWNEAYDANGRRSLFTPGESPAWSYMGHPAYSTLPHAGCGGMISADSPCGKVKKTVNTEPSYCVELAESEMKLVMETLMVRSQDEETEPEDSEKMKSLSEKLGRWTGVVIN